jgi:hypothetical protein
MDEFSVISGLIEVQKLFILIYGPACNINHGISAALVKNQSLLLD